MWAAKYPTRGMEVGCVLNALRSVVRSALGIGFLGPCRVRHLGSLNLWTC